MPMTIEVTDLGGGDPITVVALSGELDASNFERLIMIIEEAYAGGARGLVMDLAGLTFMASSGLVALYAAVRIFRGEQPPDLDAGWQVIHDLENESNAAA